MTKNPKVLVQTNVSLAIARQLDALAKATGHKRASYVRYLIELHVKALTPRLARALKQSQPKDKS